MLNLLFGADNKEEEKTRKSQFEVPF